MNVLFFPPLYQPDRFEQLRLEHLQDEITYTIRHIEYRTQNKKEYNIEKYKFHKKMRENLTLIKLDQ